MKFEVTGKIEKVLASGTDSKLYSVTEQSGEKIKKWAIWSQGNLNVGGTYNLQGYVSEYKDKKMKYEGGKDVWKTGFTAQGYTEELPF